MKDTEKQIAWAKDIIARDMETVKKYVENGYKNTPYAEDPRVNHEEDRRIMHIAEMAGFDGDDDSAEAAIEGYFGFTTVLAMNLPKEEKKLFSKSATSCIAIMSSSSSPSIFPAMTLTRRLSSKTANAWRSSGCRAADGYPRFLPTTPASRYTADEMRWA